MKKQVNKKNNYFIPIISLLFSALFLLYGCGSGGGSSSGVAGTTAVSISLNTPSAADSSATTLSSGLLSSGGVSSGGVTAQAAPVIVASIVIEITGDDMTPIVDVFNVSPGTTVTRNYDVPSGANRVVRALAYSGPMGGGNLLYEGETHIADLSGTSIAVGLTMSITDIAEAIKVLNSGDVVGAHDLFRSASMKYKGRGDNDEDTAHFFYALTRILTFWFNMQADGDNNGLYDIGDILDLYGCDGSRDPLNFDMDFHTDEDPVDAFFTGTVCPGILPVNYPGDDIKTFLQNVGTELIGAIEELDQVSKDFNFIWTEPFNNETVESDYGDVYFLRAVFKAAMAAYMVVDGYDYTLNIPADTNLDIYTFENFFNANSGFPVKTVGPGASIAWQGGAIDDFEQALNWMEEEEDSQDNDWINIVNDMDTNEEKMQKIQDGRDKINFALYCFNSGDYRKCIIDDNETPEDAADDTFIDFFPYFNNEVQISSFWPSFVGNDPVGFLPDPSFGGILYLINGNDPGDLNADKDDDGNADIFQENIFYVYGGYGLYDDALNYCNDPEVDDVFTFLGAFVFDPNNPEPVFSGAYYTYLIKFGTGDYGFFNNIKNPDMHIDAFGFLDIERTLYEFAYSADANFYIDPYYNFTGTNDGLGPEIESRNDCIKVGDSPEYTEYLKIYTMP